MMGPNQLWLRVTFWASLLLGCAAVAFVYIRLDGADPLRPVSPAERAYIAGTIDWDTRHSGWSNQKNGFASYGGNLAAFAGARQPEVNGCRHIAFTIIDASGQPIFCEETDVCGADSWAMGWDTDDRLWLVSASGAIRCWEHGEGVGWVARPYTGGMSLQPPTFD